MLTCFLWSLFAPDAWIPIRCSPRASAYLDIGRKGCNLWCDTPVFAEDVEAAPPAEETDAQPVKRAAEEEEVSCHEAEL